MKLLETLYLIISAVCLVIMHLLLSDSNNIFVKWAAFTIMTCYVDSVLKREIKNICPRRK